MVPQCLENNGSDPWYANTGPYMKVHIVQTYGDTCEGGREVEQGTKNTMEPGLPRFFVPSL